MDNNNLPKSPTPESESPEPPLADFDQPGVPTPTPVASSAFQKPDQMRRTMLGCGGVTAVLFVLLIGVMIAGLAAGEDTIKSFGFDPASLKNWTLNLVNLVFGTLSTAAVVVLILQITKRFLTSAEDVNARYHALVGTFVSAAAFGAVLLIWALVFNWLNQFQATPLADRDEILTEPIQTTQLTSPVRVYFSAEKITRNLANRYEIVSYEWDRDGDGTVDYTGEDVWIDFWNKGSANGVYNVNLVVRYQPYGSPDTAETRTYTKTVSIAKQDLYGEIIANPLSGEVPLTIKFDANEIQDPDGYGIINYTWDFNADGVPEFSGPDYRKVEHTFEKIGEHKVLLTVTSDDVADKSGRHEEKTFEKIITVLEVQETFDAEAVIDLQPPVGVAPFTTTFDATQSNALNKQKIDRYEWVISDDTGQFFDKFFEKRRSFTFPEPGIYQVVLRVIYFNGQVATDSAEVRVSDPKFAPQAVILTDPAPARRGGVLTGPAPLLVAFSGQNSLDRDRNIVSYEWDFDSDGEIDSAAQIAEYEYRDEGQYRVTLLVTDADGNAAEAQIDIVVGSELPVVDLGPSVMSGPAPLTIDFDASGSRFPGKQIISYEWDFDSAKSGRNKETFKYKRAQTSHIFEAIGEYVVKLTLHADDGTTAENTIKVIATYQSLQSFFTPSRASGSAPLTISFNGSESEGVIDRREWDFDDATTSEEVSPTHTFADPGIYDVVLRIYDDQGNVSEYSQEIVAQ